MVYGRNNHFFLIAQSRMIRFHDVSKCPCDIAWRPGYLVGKLAPCELVHFIVGFNSVQSEVIQG